MSTLSLRLPDSLHKKVRDLAAQDDISINQFIATAVAEKMAALMTLDYLAERAARGNRTAFERVLRKVPKRPPLPGDEWEPGAAEEPDQRLQPTKARRSAKTRRGKK
jgi:hypothetical protein